VLTSTDSSNLPPPAAADGLEGEECDRSAEAVGLHLTSEVADGMPEPSSWKMPCLAQLTGACRWVVIKGQGKEGRGAQAPPRILDELTAAQRLVQLRRPRKSILRRPDSRSRPSPLGVTTSLSLFFLS